MPSKGHKRASTQAKLQKKRRRGKDIVHNFKATPILPKVVDDTNKEATDDPTLTEAVRSEMQLSLPTKTKRGSTTQAPVTYPYLSNDLRQIGIIAGLVIAILATLAFFLN